MTRQDIRQELDTIISENKEHGAPENESNTCDHVILPLLYAMGYTRREVRSRTSDTAGKFPDYTILPDSPHTWFLEAKGWKEKLDTKEADQAINYAHREGRRWVVLTNGRDWRLYDDSIAGVSNADRLVSEATITEDEGLLDLLEALSKPSIVSGAIDRSVFATQLRSVLEVQLTNNESEVVKAVCKVIQKLPGMHSTKPADIASYFGQRALAPMKRAAPEDALRAEDLRQPQGNENPSEPFLVDMAATHRSTKPQCIVFGPSDRVAVVTWKDVAREILARAIQQGNVPNPFRIGRSKGFFLASAPESMREGAALGELWFESHFSADELMRNVITICEAANFDWRSIRIERKIS